MTKKPKRATTRGKPDWDKQVNYDIEFAKRSLLESGEIGPIFIIHTADTAMAVASAIDRGDKKDFYALLRCMCIANNATALSFIAEAWMRRVPEMPNETKEENIRRATAVAPGDAEDRIEVAMAHVNYRGADGMHNAHKFVEINRDWNGKITGFSEVLGEETDEGGGMLTHILPEQEPSQALRDMARAALPMLCAALGFNMKTIDLEGGNA